MGYEAKAHPADNASIHWNAASSLAVTSPPKPNRMPLTFSCSKALLHSCTSVEQSSGQSGGPHLRADPRCDPLLLRILGRRRLHQGPHQRLVRGDPVSEHGPLRAVPLLELDASTSLMIATGESERGDQALRPHLLERRGWEGEVLEPPLYLRPCQGLVPEFAHGRAEPLRGEQSAQHAPDPIRRADIPFWPRPLALGIDVLEYLPDEREVSPHAIPAR